MPTGFIAIFKMRGPKRTRKVYLSGWPNQSLKNGFGKGEKGWVLFGKGWGLLENGEAQYPMSVAQWPMGVAPWRMGMVQWRSIVAQ